MLGVIFMAGAQQTRTTFYFELWRSGAAGVIETAGTTFLLLVAVRWFEAGALAKGLVAGAGSVGLLFSPVLVSLVARRGWTPSIAAGRVLATGAGAFLIAAIFPSLPVFCFCSVLAMATSSAIIPLLTQIYQENYPEHERGRRFSRTIMVRIFIAILFGKLAGDALSGHLRQFPLLLVVFASALALAAYCVSRCPSRPLHNDGGVHPLRALRFVREDPLFRRTLICWMFMGFANLMMAPLRVEYLASPRYHLDLTIAMIALLTSVVPNVARLALSPVWGYLFDHMNFFTLRITLNIGFAVGILAFFMSNTLWGMIMGAVIFGISNAGGDVAWSLWVTKFAPPGRVADYMSVHTFFTGVRGVAAPLVAFYLATKLNLSLGMLAGVCSALILAATWILLPELREKQKTADAKPLMEGLSE
jgi:MFS family permease